MEGLRDIRWVVAIARPTPLYVGGTSRVLLAALPDNEIVAYFDRTECVPPFRGAKVDARILWRAIAAIRRDGCAETHNKRLR